MQRPQQMQLELQQRQRRAGRNAHDVWFLDFVINGKSLLNALGQHADLVSVLAFFPDTSESIRSAHRLLLQQPADLPNERRSLYVCGECGDVTCGAITVVIEEIGDTIVWRAFGYQNDYDDNSLLLADFQHIGPFGFQKAAYEAVIQQSINLL